MSFVITQIDTLVWCNFSHFLDPMFALFMHILCTLWPGWTPNLPIKILRIGMYFCNFWSDPGLFLPTNFDKVKPEKKEREEKTDVPVFNFFHSQRRSKRINWRAHWRGFTSFYEKCESHPFEKYEIVCVEQSTRICVWSFTYSCNWRGVDVWWAGVYVWVGVYGKVFFGVSHIMSRICLIDIRRKSHFFVVFVTQKSP